MDKYKKNSVSNHLLNIALAIEEETIKLEQVVETKNFNKNQKELITAEIDKLWEIVNSINNLVDQLD